MSEKRLIYIDNIRILLTGIVILHHLSITYGAPGGWYYREFEVTDLNLIPLITLVLFATANQAYFMGFFFLISGFFSAKSLSEKGTQTFLIQRLMRLGIPLLFFVYLLSPILRLSLRRILYQIPVNAESIRSTYHQIEFGYELGPMWFVILVLIFSILLPLAAKTLQQFSVPENIPQRQTFILAAFFTGLLTFLVRIPQPIGSVFQPLNLQIPYLIQYIVLFLFGAIVHQRGWITEVSSITLKFWLPFLFGLIIFMPVLFFLSGGARGDVTPALGGIHWQSFALAIWEQFFCASMIAVLLFIFQKTFDRKTKLSYELSASSYAAFIVHPIVLVILAAVMRDLRYPPLLKITLAAIPALLLSFLSASLLRRIPGLRTLI